MTTNEESHRLEVERTTRESAIYLVSKAIPLFCNLLFIKFYTHSFTAETIGEYETLLAMAMMASSLAVGWLQLSLLRFFPKCSKEGRLYDLMAALSVGFIGSMAVSIPLGMALWLCRHTDWGTALYLNLLPGVAILFLSNSLFTITTTLLRAKRFPVRFSLATASYSFFNLSFVYLSALFFGSLLLSLVAGSAAALILPSLVILFFSGNRSMIENRTKWTGGGMLGPLLLFGLPLSLNQAASQILNLSDRYLILVLVGEREAGLYAVIYRIGDFAVRFVILSLMMSAYTSVTETFEQRGREAAERLVASLTRFYLLLAAPLVVGTWVVQRDVVQVLSGPEYMESAGLLGWILLGNFFLGLSQYSNFGLHLSQRTWTLTAITLACAALNITLNCLLLPRYGYPVAAYTTCLSFLLLTLLTPLLANRHLTWKIRWLSVVRILTATTLMAATLHFFSNPFDSPVLSLFAVGICGSTIYGLALLCLREISLDDLRRFR